jgi:cytoskeletal protein CcmA (bactofilin family)
MWRKPEEAKTASPVGDTPAPTPAPVDAVRSVAGLTAEVVQPSGGLITSSIVIKGEIRGREDLYIDGEIQGTIQLSEGRVTVGPHGKISADIDAREIIVRGKVKGAVRGRERVEVGRTADISGNVVTLRISIEEGAQIHSNVEITRANQTAKSGNEPQKPAASEAPKSLVMKASGESK